MKEGEKIILLFKVNEEVYLGFKSTFRDCNPLHTNADFARNKGFRSEVMYGNILCGFLSYFVGEKLPDKEVIIHSQEINYLNPFYLGDELRFTAIIDHVHESVRVIEFKYLFENQTGQRIAKGRISIGLL